MNRVQRILRTYKTTITGGFAVLIPLTVLIAAVSLPHSFTSGDLLTATKLNENFDALKKSIKGQEVVFSGLSVTQGSTRYMGVGLVCINSVDPSCKRRIITDGTITRFEVRSGSNTVTNPTTFKLMKGGSQVAVLTVPASQSDHVAEINTLNEAAIAGETLQIEVDTGSGSQNVIGPFQAVVEIF